MSTRKKYALMVVIAIVTISVYLPALQNGFVLWDDDIVITENMHIRSLNWSFFHWAITDVATAGYWHPVTWISHAVDYALWGANPAGHHLTSILLHAVNTILVMVLVIHLLRAAETSVFHIQKKDGEGMLLQGNEQSLLIAAGIAGVLFGIHPMHVESVAWLSERKGLLSSLFYLLSMIAYIKHVALQGRVNAERAYAHFWTAPYGASLLCFVLALTSKPIALTLPLILLLLDWYPCRRTGSLRKNLALIAEKVPFLAAGALVAVITYRAQQSSGFLTPLDMVPVSTRVLVMFRSLFMYLWNTALPCSLNPLYPYPATISAMSLEYLGTAALIGGMTGASILAAKRQRLWLSLLGCYVIMLLPVLGLLQIGYQYMADRYVYLPSLVPFLLIGIAMANWWVGGRSMQQRSTAVRSAMVLIGLVLGITLALLTVSQIRVWKNTVSLWSHVIGKEPGSTTLPYINRGTEYAKQEQPDLALNDFDTAIALDPANSAAYGNRGRVLHGMGLHARALEDYAMAINLSPAYYYVFNNRGLLYKDLGKYEEAIADYTSALVLNPSYGEAFTNRGILYGETGRADLAMQDFTSAIAANPYYADAYTARGLVLIHAGHPEQALQDLDKAVSLKPSSVEAYLNRGIAHETMDRLELAVEDYTTAIKLNPSDSLVYNSRGRVFAKMRRIDAAVEDQTRALSLKPDYAEAYLDRGDCYRTMGKRALAKEDYQKACKLGVKSACAAVRAASP